MQWSITAFAPRNEVPVGIPAFGELGRSDTAFVAITSVCVYTTGLSFVVSVRLRQEPRGLGHRISELISGDPSRERDVPAEQQLWFGVEYPDGRIATTVWEHFGNDPDGSAIHLWCRGGHGGSRAYDTEYWLAPLPPTGSLTFVCAWPLFNIPETRTVVDGEVILEALSRTEILWPDEPDAVPEEEPDPPTPPPGWFTDAMGRT
jgi:hypothetical protein